MIELKDIQGNVILSTEINKGAKRKFELMKEDYITLPFSLDTPVDFGLGAYVDIDAGLFEVTDLQKPTYNNTTGGYDYQLRLDAYYWKWKNKIFKFTPEVGGQEASWSLTASLDVHLDIFLRNLKALGYTYRGSEFEFSIDATVENKAMSMTYDNTNMIDALSAMAESWDCEWWVTDNIIHFGRCEYGTAVDFEIGVNVAEMTSSASQSSYATRLYVFGSTRNLPSDYRPVDEDVLVNGVVQRRLMLPEGTPYLDAYENMSEEEAIEEVVIIEDIYPKTDGNISSVTTYEDSVENEDGTTTTETFYRFTDEGINFSKDYILEGEELKVKFTSGSLNGMEFGIAFNPNGEAEKLEDGSWNPATQLYEVVVNEDYGRKLPDSTLHPKVDDTYILIGWDSTKITDLGLVSKAEEELLSEGREILAKRKIDPNTYNCKMFSDYMYGLDEEGNQNPQYSKTFEVGDKVNLINPTYFKDGRQSRIIGYEYSLDFPFDNPIYTIGETASYSRLGELEEKIDSLVYKGQTYTGGSGSGVYVIGTNDTTKPTNRNVFSALRSQKDFLSKVKDDRSTGKVASDVGFEVGEYVSGASGAIIYKDATTGQTVGELDKLRVRMKAYFETLEIINVNSVAGKMILSPGGSVKCIGVEEVDADEDGTADAYRCYFLGEQDGELIENRFVAGDQAFSQMFNAKTGVSNKVSNHYYWRLVTAVSEDVVEYDGKQCHYIDLSITDCDADSDVPKVGDVINQRGSREDADRMNFIEFSSVDAFSPNITLFHGVNSYSLDGKAYVDYGVDKSTNKAYMNVYGDMYVGDRNKTAYLRYTQEGGLEICGKLAVGTKLGDTDLKTLIDSATPEGYAEFVDKVTADIEGLQNQIDGAIESFFYQYDPTLENYPASEWVADGTEKMHLNDTFTNLSSGYSWRWTKDEKGVYGWTAITDIATVNALALAGKAQDTADGKRRVFVDTPVPPYDEGDLWAGGSESYLMKCITAKASGEEYSADDWDYADNASKIKAQVDSTKTDLEKAITDAEAAAKTYTDEAKAAVEETIAALDEAKANLDDVYTKATADGKITEAEQAAIDAAKEASDAAIALSEETVKAYADGVVDEEEAARIKQAEENLEAAKAYAEEKAAEALAEANKNIATFDYLKAALNEVTTIDGGLILSSLIKLQHTDNIGSHVMSGINGIYNEESTGGGIATWWGGDIHEWLDYYEWDGAWKVKDDVEVPTNMPSGAIRFDGTGYFANGNFWWDADGQIHADPTALLLSFDVETGDETLAATIIDIRKQIAQFNSMWTLKTDASGNSYLLSSYHIATNGGITMYSADGVEVGTVFDALPIDGGTIYWGEDEDGNKVLKAKAGTEGAITSITKDMVVDALGYTPFDSTNFTTANIKDVLGISDWALASSKPSYTTSEVSEGTNLYFTDARAVSALSSTLSGYLPLSGGTMTGILTLKAGQFYSEGNYVINLNNSDIIKANSIYFSDLASTNSEGLMFARTDGNWDVLRAEDGVLKFKTSEVTGAATTDYYTVLHSGNYNNYSPTLTGTGASGTWGISVTGNAATATTATNSTKFNGYTMRDGSGHDDYSVDAVVQYTIDTTSLSTSNFYPIFFKESSKTLYVDIRSQGGIASVAYNQNRLEFTLRGQGWNDTPKGLTVHNYNCFSATETTIGCIAMGTTTGGKAVWVRGGFYYYVRSNYTPSLKTSAYTVVYSTDTSKNEIYSVGTNFYGGTNTNVSVMWTPQSTSGLGSMYHSDGLVLGGGVSMSGALSGATTGTFSGQVSMGSAKVNGGSLTYDSANGYWKLEGDLLVTGGISMYSSDTAFTPSTITEAVNVDGVTIKKDATTGALYFAGSIDGGVASEVAWSNVTGKPNTLAGYGITDAKIASGVITLGSNTITPLTQALGDARYVPLSNTAATYVTSNQAGVLNFKSTAASTGIRLYNGDTNKGGLWWESSYGVCIYNATTSDRLGINDSGTPYFHDGSSSYTLLHSGNFTPSNYMPKTGGTFTGDVKVTATTDRPYGNTFHIARTPSVIHFWSAGETESYGYLGFNSAGTPCMYGATGSNDSLKYLLHSGNYNNYSPTLTGTGASGTWGISVTGNAATATKLGTTTLGSTTKPIYLSSGTATACSTYAGGTAVTLNGTSKAASTASFYAPTSAGTSDYVLTSTAGSPSWTAQSSLSVGSATKLATARTIWGQSFNGTANVSGALTGVTSISITQDEWVNGLILNRSVSGGGCGIKVMSNGTWIGTLGINGSKQLEFDVINSGVSTNVMLVDSSSNVSFQKGTDGRYLIIKAMSGSICYYQTTSGGWAMGNVFYTNAGTVTGGISAYGEGGTLSYYYFGKAYNDYIFKVDTSGNVLTSGGITMYSDIRKKTKLQDVELTLKQVADAPLIEHYYNGDEKKTTHVGSVAQYWAGMNDWFCKEDGEGFLTMEIQNAALASAISVARELVKYESKTDRKIRLLKKRICELEDEIDKLKNK